MSVELAPEHVESIRVAARARYPEEACGLLLGVRDEAGRTVVNSVLRTRNLAPEKRRAFEVHPEDHLRAEQQAAALGLAVVGIWHSHPDGEAQPSERDRAESLEHWDYVIAAVDARGLGRMRAFRRSTPGAGDLLERTLLAGVPVAASPPGRDNEPTMTIHDDERVHGVLQGILEYELAGVIRFTHYALMVRGPHRIPIVDFFQQQAVESLTHAQRAGEILTGFGGHPSMAVAPVQETHQHSVQAILEESYVHETSAIEMYQELVRLAEGKSVFLEEYARSMVAAEEEHVMELRKMMRDLEV